MRLQCLKCKHEFLQSLAPWQQGPYPARAGDTESLETLVASNQGRLWSLEKGYSLVPEQTTRVAAVLQSIERTGEGDALVVLELQPVWSVLCRPTWTGLEKSLPSSPAGISHCFTVKQVPPLLWAALGLGER